MINRKYLILLLIPTTIFIYNNFGYAYNITCSLPYKHFLIIKKVQIKQGSYILFSAPKKSQYAGMDLIKQIVGVNGMEIRVVGSDIYVDGVFVGKAKPYSKSGAKLAVITNKFIPENNYFVAAEHVDSYDSRYREFGLINEKNIIGVAIALW